VDKCPITYPILLLKIIIKRKTKFSYPWLFRIVGFKNNTKVGM